MISETWFDFLLQICAASQKKLLAGLDSTQTDGVDALTSLEDTIHQLHHHGKLSYVCSTFHCLCVFPFFHCGLHYHGLCHHDVIWRIKTISCAFWARPIQRLVIQTVNSLVLLYFLSDFLRSRQRDFKFYHTSTKSSKTISQVRFQDPYLSRGALCGPL